MANPKNGCGFLLTALIILVLGGGIAAFLGFGAFDSGKEFTENIRKGESFVTPQTLTYTPKENSEVTAWILRDEALDLSTIDLEYTDTSTGITKQAAKPNGTSNINEQHLLAVFSVEKDKTYEIAAKGAADGSTILISDISPTAVFSMIGRGLGAFGVAGITVVLVLVFGIIGLVKFLGSKKQPPHQSPPPIS
jgi:hypothetical protein